MPLMAMISPCHQAIDARGDRIGRGNRASGGVDQPHLRPADPAGIGLRVEAAIQGVVVFGLACGHMGKIAIEVCGRS